MLVLARKLHEKIVIGDDIVVSVVDIRGDQVKLGIEAPNTVRVFRHEVYQAVVDENLTAAQVPSAELPPLPPLGSSSVKED